ncbi:MAG TPA: hypothetical protein VGQ83_29120 [Polyangia bacterium]|jgi:hypothetical protein
MVRTCVTLVAAALAASLCGGGCGPATSAGGVPQYPPRSDLSAAGHRCHGAACACRPLVGGDQEEQQPPKPGTKRYEVRIPVTVHPVWINVAGVGTFYKPGERGDETCVYFDLAPGDHDLTYKIAEHTSNAGFPAILRVSEYGGTTKAWYEVFLVDCGTAEGACTKSGLGDWVKETASRKGLIDSCSSTRFRNVRWTADEWEGGKLRDLAVTVALKVYKFEPTRAPRSRCEGRTKPAEGGAPAPEPEAPPAE